jgi:hypothetical protein
MMNLFGIILLRNVQTMHLRLSRADNEHELDILISKPFALDTIHILIPMAITWTNLLVCL